MKETLWIPVVAALVVSTVSAQRGWSHASFIDSNNGRFFRFTGPGGLAKWKWRIGPNESSGAVTLPTSQVGAALAVGIDRLLVSGNSPIGGWLAEIQFTPGPSGISASLTSIPTGPLDLVQLAYSNATGLLFAIDANSQNLVVASLLPGPVVGPWQVVATPSQCPILSTRSRFLVVEPLANDAGVTVSAREPFEAWMPRVVMRDSAGEWIITDPSASAPPLTLPPTWFVSAYPMLVSNSNEQQIWIGGGSGDFSIVEMNEGSSVVHLQPGSSVFSGTHSGAADGEVFSIPATQLEHGRLYAVEGGAFARSVPFRAESVWQRASVDPNMVPAKVGIRWDFPVVGMDFVSWELFWRSGLPQPVDPVLLTMVVGPWEYGSNPTVPALGVEILAAPWGTLGAQVATWENRGRLSFGWTFAVDNPTFVGWKVAMQAVGVLSTGQFIVSDVAGVRLVPW